MVINSCPTLCLVSRCECFVSLCSDIFSTMLFVRHYSSWLLWHSPAAGSQIPDPISPHSHPTSTSQFLLFPSFRNVLCHSIDELTWVISFKEERSVNSTEPLCLLPQTAQLQNRRQLFPLQSPRWLHSPASSATRWLSSPSRALCWPPSSSDGKQSGRS